MGTYVQKLNGNYIAAYEVVPNSPLAQQLATIGAGAFQVADPVDPSGDPPDYTPDVLNPSPKIIYLTKDPNSSAFDPYYEWIYVTETGQVSADWKCIGETSIDLSGYKVVQEPVSDPSPVQDVSGLTFISSLSQNAQGVISLIKGTVQDASTSQKGVVQLQGTIGANETSDTTAATPKAVRDAINDLDVTAVTVGASKTLASISETDGKISATAVDIQISESQVTDLTTDLASKADKSTTVTNVAYDTTNKKITKTINGTTTDVVTLSQLESDLDLSGKEDVSNKVSSWSSTTTDDHYPSEKLVKTALDGKQESLSFDGTYNASTNKAATVSSITDRIDALDATVASTGGTNVALSVTEADGIITAVAVTTDNTENKNNKVTAFQSTPDNTHYPSEKLVKDSLDGKADKVASATSGNFAGLDSTGNLTDSGYSASSFATAAQGTLASTAVQSVKVYNDSTELNNSGNVVIPKADDGTASNPGKYGVVQIECINI